MIPRSKLLALAHAVSLALALSFAPGLASAAPGDVSTAWPVNDDDPTSNIPSIEDRNAHPLEFGYFIQDLIARAEPAYQKKDWATAAKYLEALAKAMPDVAISFSQLCNCYAELSKVDRAIQACSHAVRLDGALIVDHFHLVNVLLMKKKLSSGDVAAIDASLAHVRAHGPSETTEASEAPDAGAAQAILREKTPEEIKADFMALRERSAQAQLRGEIPTSIKRPVHLALELEVLTCRVAVKLRNTSRMDRCLTALAGVRADRKIVLPFEWSRALVVDDRARAEALLDEAKKLGFPPATLASMSAEQDKNFARKKAGLARNLSLALVVLLGVGGIAIGWALGKKRKDDGPQVSAKNA